MFRNTTLLQRSFAVLAVGASLGVACSAPPPDNDDDKTTGSSSDSDKTTEISFGDGDGDGGLTTGGIDIKDKPATEHCGDGILDDDEACDDGTPGGMDGCGANCLYVEEGFLCATPGEPCRPYSKCGDGVTVFPEQCDAGGLVVPGCTAECKLELGYKCDGANCTRTVCGDGAQEGTETCEDGNTLPFDGCDANCNKEPDCSANSGMGCTSSCGDGLIIGDEECDDGNGVSGDGCSADCKEEPGYKCSVPETVDPALPIDLPIVFRDFNVGSPSDFRDAEPGDSTTWQCDGFHGGIAAATLNPAGKPVFASAPAKSCVTEAGFAQWYVESDVSGTVLGSIRLYNNGKGGYVNRFGANGEPYLASVKTEAERNAGTSQATCETSCLAFARDGQPPFATPLRCDDTCRPAVQEAQQLRDNNLVQAQNALTQAENANPVDEDLVAERQAAVEAIEAAIVVAEEAAETCATDCQAELDARVATCTPQCAPCSSGSGWCIGGELLELDGNPLFFPMDNAEGAITPVAAYTEARIPAQIYQGLGWPWEGSTGLPENPPPGTPKHNFHFTSEIAYWFEYNEGTVADLTFLGDDDVFVFINRRLVVDIGGIHVPLGGQLSLTAGGVVTSRVWQPPDPGEPMKVLMPEITKTMTAADLGLTPGNVYEIKVFQAERKPEGSSFQLTLSGFNAARSTCVATCGDGIIAGGEQCDNGTELNTGGHNGCTAECELGSYCGDGIVQEADGEECDDNAPGASADCSNCRLGIIR